MSARIYTPTADGTCAVCGRPQGEHSRQAWGVVCLSGGEPLAPGDFEARVARAVIEAIGMSWSSLTPEAKRAAVTACDRAKGGR